MAQYPFACTKEKDHGGNCYFAREPTPKPDNGGLEREARRLSNWNASHPEPSRYGAILAALKATADKAREEVQPLLDAALRWDRSIHAETKNMEPAHAALRIALGDYLRSRRAGDER